MAALLAAYLGTELVIQTMPDLMVPVVSLFPRSVSFLLPVVSTLLLCLSVSLLALLLERLTSLVWVACAVLLMLQIIGVPSFVFPVPDVAEDMPAWCFSYETNVIVYTIAGLGVMMIGALRLRRRRAEKCALIKQTADA